MTWVSVFAASAETGQLDVVGEFLIPLIVGLVAGSVGATLVSQIFASSDRRRDLYSEAVAVLVSWCEYPFMIRRRVNDDSETLQRLAGVGHELQERIARAEAWVTAESRDMGERYSKLVENLREDIGPLTTEAWKSSPVSSASEMVLDGWGVEACSRTRDDLKTFRKQSANRFGWNRLRGK